MSVSIYDIAKRLGVSPATISRGLHDHPGIGKKTKAKIRELAKEMGYPHLDECPLFSRYVFPPPLLWE